VATVPIFAVRNNLVTSVAPHPRPRCALWAHDGATRLLFQAGRQRQASPAPPPHPLLPLDNAVRLFA